MGVCKKKDSERKLKWRRKNTQVFLSLRFTAISPSHFSPFLQGPPWVNFNNIVLAAFAPVGFAPVGFYLLVHNAGHRAVVLKQGVATHLCAAGFFWCVTKNF
jgi:hypothetical protein